MNRTLLVLDGHDGAGKSTLALLLAEALGGVCVRPFSRRYGVRMVAEAESGDAAIAARLARECADGVLAAHDAPLLVCDRHWLTVFALLPECFWASWQPLPPTTLVWADLATTLARVAPRSEVQYAPAYHDYYLRRYWDVGQRFGCNVVRTDTLTVAECLDRLVDWAWHYLT